MEGSGWTLLSKGQAGALVCWKERSLCPRWILGRPFRGWEDSVGPGCRSDLDGVLCGKRTPAPSSPTQGTLHPCATAVSIRLWD